VTGDGDLDKDSDELRSVLLDCRVDERVLRRDDDEEVSLLSLSD